MERRNSLLTWYFFFASTALILIYFFITAERTSQNIFLVSLIVLLMAFAIFVYQEHFHLEKKLRLKMKELSDDAPKESFDHLRESYMQIYRFYLKLSEKKKRNFYSRVNMLREDLEKKITAEKSLQALLKKSVYASWKELEAIHKELEEKLLQLPQKVRDVYYQEVSNIKDMLEHRNK